MELKDKKISLDSLNENEDFLLENKNDIDKRYEQYFLDNYMGSYMDLNFKKELHLTAMKHNFLLFIEKK